jgi:hypothetical protein
MDIEFHYYMTYLIAARAGFEPEHAEIIAHAAQSVDDNHLRYRVRSPDGEYLNYVSQTMDILKPTSQLAKIYPIFHFIPGDPDAPSAARKDGRKDPWVTTPNSPVAQKMLRSALASGNLYRIGVSAHGFVDTWAHQNFLGRRDAFNDLPGASWVKTLLNVGHGSAGHQPDQPALVWTDARLVEERVDNRRRFLEAAQHLFIRLALHVNPDREEAALAADCAALAHDLNEDIGPEDARGDPALRQARIGRYVARAATPPYGGIALEHYDEYAWFNAAIVEEAAGLRQKLDRFLGLADDYIDQTTAVPCTWRDPTGYTHTHWHRLVEAVKAHQIACWDILVAEDLPGLGANDLAGNLAG